MSRVDELYQARPKNRFVRVSLWGLLALVVGSWILGSVTGAWSLSDFFSERRWSNAERFFFENALPSLGDNPTGGDYFGWAKDQFFDRGLQASLGTLAISVAAIVLSAIVALILLLPAARTVATAEPYVQEGRVVSRPRQFAWRFISGFTRLLLVFLRAIPEYVWAFILITLFGVHAWPAVLALAIHNSGILTKLGAEVLENTPPATPSALRSLGASRAQLSLYSLLPRSFSRFLLYFFYRWETCVRDATVLGMLGFSSLGYWILEARAKDRYDEMIFLMLLGAALVLLGDAVSAIARVVVRRAS